MPKSLVIVESPAKAKTINKYLGQDYIVEASMGHVKDLPKGGIAIDIERGFVPTYEVIRNKKTVISRLKNLAQRCDKIVLATDPDREGEAIAWHVAQEVADRGTPVSRVLFNEITKSGVVSAMRQPREIDMKMVQAQEARRVMDRLIGYKVSPFLWRTFVNEAKGLSAGRVQSVALRLVVEREKEIRSFIPIEYWNIYGMFETEKGETLRARLVRHDGITLRNPKGSADQRKEQKDGKKEFIANKGEAEDIRARAMREKYAVTDVERKEVRRKAHPPFTTSTLQQDAGRKLRMRSKKVMSVAQKLYEGVELGPKGLVGLITYMRTDSVRISDEAGQMAEEFIYENFGKEYLPKTKKEHSPKKGANVQDAHEAIRPTDVKITPKIARKYLEKEQADLYELIWNRFVASRMADALFDQTTVEIEGGAFLFRATGRIQKFRGWMQVYADQEEEDSDTGEDEKESAQTLPEGLRKGMDVAATEMEIKQSATKPPPRYSESLLVKEMEAKGIGRPSTYASIIGTIQERGYVEQKSRKLFATELGIKVSDMLVKNFPKLFDVKFTARMEKDLDTIAGGEATYLSVMKRFYSPFHSSLQAVQIGSGIGNVGGEGIEQRKKRSRSLAKAGKGRTKKGERKQAVAQETGEKCDKCGAPMVRRRGKNGEFQGCSAYPNCKNTKPLPLGITCPLCSKGSVVERVGGRYKSVFYGCSRYPECRFTSSAKPVNRTCGNCGNHWLVQAYHKDEGNFIECPKCKARVMD